MRYRVLAADYDGTLALHGQVPPEVVESLRSLKASGRLLVLVTGRELDELKSIFPEWQLFDRIVAENGALLFIPSTLEEKPLAPAPPDTFVQELRKHNVLPLSVGRVIVATWEPHQATVLEIIKRTGFERQVIFNKGAVMILPPGVNKYSGLAVALEELQHSIHNVVAVGDAENDGAMLQAAECAVVVANALPGLKEMADWVTEKDHGHGVMTLIEKLQEDDLRFLDPVLHRHHLPLGDRYDGQPFKISPYGRGILLAGSSGGGKSTLSAAFMESLLRQHYQFCLIDPEGDYTDMEGVVSIGDATHPPVIEELVALLTQPSQSVVACTLALTMEEKPAFMQQLLAALQPLQQRTGRPHWLLLDEAHHLAPASADPGFFSVPQGFRNYMLITTDPALVHPQFLECVDLVMAIGDTPEHTLQNFSTARQQPLPATDRIVLQKGEALVWDLVATAPPFLLRCAAPAKLLQRHKRKYSKGDMGPDSFVFTGPENKLRLKAYNLITFMQLGNGVDDTTWMYHLKNHDYSSWFKGAVNDEELGQQIYRIEEAENDPAASRQKIQQLIEGKYTGPA